MTIRITREYVRQMGAHAEQFTDGAVKEPQTGADIGHGPRIMNMNDNTAWYGDLRGAAAFYMGTMLGWARQTGAEIPADVAEFCRPMRDLVNVNAKLRAEQERGEADGAARAEVHGMRDRKSA